jgi:hypothetical protein
MFLLKHLMTDGGWQFSTRWKTSLTRDCSFMHILAFSCFVFVWGRMVILVPPFLGAFGSAIWRQGHFCFLISSVTVICFRFCFSVFCVLHLYLSVDDSRVLTSSHPALVSWGGSRLRLCACSDYAYVLAMKLSKSTQLLCLRLVFGTLFAWTTY